MKPQIVQINDEFRVEIDEYNHTLTQHRPTKKRPDFWYTVGYYSTMAGALNKLTQKNVLKGKDTDLVSYAQAVLEQAKSVVDTVRKR